MDPIFLENLIKVGMAVLVGGIIGAEREYQDKAAGFRTMILITLGSTLIFLILCWLMHRRELAVRANVGGDGTLARSPRA